jgi:hypothetical protein
MDGETKTMAHPGVKTGVGRGKPEMIAWNQKKLNAFNRLLPNAGKVGQCRPGWRALECGFH